MNGLLWALLVFFGHLIGLLVFLIVRQDHPVGGAPAASKSSAPPASRSSSPPAAAATSATVPLACPSCKKPIDGTFAYCPHCGTALQPVCKNCGKPVDAAWKACPYCGAAP